MNTPALLRFVRWDTQMASRQHRDVGRAPLPLGNLRARPQARNRRRGCYTMPGHEPAAGGLLLAERAWPPGVAPTTDAGRNGLVI